MYDKLLTGELNFYNLKSLFGAVMTTRRPVIANDASNDQRATGVPPGHPPLNAFLGIPLISGSDFVGVVGLANAVGGYSEETVTYLMPIIQTCANIINAYKQMKLRDDVEIRLKQAQLAADAANKAKTAFLAHMSHEIRNPIGVMIGFAEMLRNPSLNDPDKSTYAETIYRNGQSVLSIINDLLDLSKVEANKLELAPIEFDFIDLFHKTADSMQIKARENGIELSVIVGEQVPTIIKADPVRIRQVLVNLLSNAIKFTAKGTVTLTAAPCVSEAEAPQGKARLEFTVTDTGCGIDANQQGNLFKSFSQADPSITRKYGGTGLGLCLSKSLAQAMGGDVTLKSSAIGKGSTFVATFAYEPVNIDAISMTTRGSSDEPPPNNIANPVLRGKSILVVEDCEESQLLIRTILEIAGAMVDIATNGKEGVTKASNGQYNFILMDIEMPVLDGRAATTLLRQRGYTGPIIALTAHALTGDRGNCIAVGFSDFITKPFSRDDLIETLLSCERNADNIKSRIPPSNIQPSSVVPGDARELPTIGKQALNVCFVDDEPEICNLYQMQFRNLIQKGTCKITCVTSGQACLDLLNAGQNIDVVIADLNMPNMDGYELLEILQREFPRIKILVCSAFSDSAHIQRSLAEGARKYFCKPLQMNELENELFSTRHAGAGLQG